MSFRCLHNVLLVSVVLVGCSTRFALWAASPTTVPELAAIHRIDPLDHLVYMGSDERWHYFYHSQLFGGGSYKVERATLVFPDEREVGTEPSDFLGGTFNARPDGTFAYEPYGSQGASSEGRGRPDRHR
jgi:hypothetical protein